MPRRNAGSAPDRPGRLKPALLGLVLAVAAAAAAEEPIPGNPLVAIPAGRFVFGEESPTDASPARRIDLPAFAINKHEITNAQFRAFVAATGHRPAFFAEHPELGADDRPVVGVSWADADAFCRHHGLRLPNERQFERAARGRDGAPHPWGDAPATAHRANRGAAACCGPDAADGYAMTAPVGRFPEGASAEGVFDLIGNVWEWTDDWYAPGQQFKVLRGGAWNSDDPRLRATHRLAYHPEYRFAGNGGFRCVASSP